MDAQTALFQQHRQRLFGLAYRMLGTPSDAEDVLHDAWLRWHAQDLDALDDPEAWLVTVTTRLALDRLRRARTEREHYTGPWLPEPLPDTVEAPPDQLERAESLNLSFLLLLERLSADERAAFLLREVFDYSHAEAARMLGIGEEACRQRVHRAKTRLREGRPRFEVAKATRERLLQRLLEAMAQPTLETLSALFAEDAVHIADGGGLASATLRPLHGAERLARLYLQIVHNVAPRHPRWEMRSLNGEPMLLLWVDNQLASAMWIDGTDEGITAVHAIRHPDKLARIEAVTKPGTPASLQ
jgi:RNA polymerase sigma-70 factor (ECF subfamily)